MPVDLKKQVEEMQKLHYGKLKGELPAILATMQQQGIEAALKAVPDIFPKIINKILEYGAARFVAEEQGLMNSVLSLIWEAVDKISMKKEGTIKACNKISEGVKIRDISVNFEAIDSPLKSFVRVNDKAEFTYGLGVLHFKDQDYKVYGPTDALLKFFIGEATLGAWSELDYEGLIGPFGAKASPILKNMFIGFRAKA